MLERVTKAWTAAAPAGSAPAKLLLMGRWAGEMTEERLIDWNFRRRGLSTMTVDPLVEAGDSFGYRPTTWRVLREVFPPGSLGTGDVLLDLGCGKGRATLWAASSFPLQRAIGIDIARDLLADAEANRRRWRGPAKCGAVEFLCADAREFPIPDEVTDVFLHNPFGGEIFARVLDNILASLARKQRPLRISYVYPLMHDTLAGAGWTAARHRANHSWVSTGANGAGAAPSFPPYLWAVYEQSQGGGETPLSRNG